MIKRNSNAGGKTVLFTLSLLFVHVLTAQSDYYWVGGTGNWSDYAHHWATTSGGTTFHNTAPSQDDNVFFDAQSFTASDQSVTIDVEDVEVADMDWRGVQFNPMFTYDRSMEYQTLMIYGTTHLDPSMEFDLEYIGFEPETETQYLYTEDVSFGEATVHFFCRNAGFEVFGDITCSDIGFVNMFEDLDFNGASINASDKFELRLAIYGTIDLTNVSISTKSFRLTSGLGANGQILASGASVSVNYPDGTTTIDKSRHPVPLFENYTISADHMIVNEDANFDNLIIESGVDLQIHDYIAGIEFNSLTAIGTAEERIKIRSTKTNTPANLIKTDGEVNVHLVDITDIHGTGGATFNAYGSQSEGSVSGWNFIKADQEITLNLEARDYEDINSTFEMDGYASSGLHITYESSNEDVAVISGANEVLITGIGTTQITANQSGDLLFNAAPKVIRSLEVTKAEQTITFEEISDIWVGEEVISLAASTTSGLDVDYEIVGPATLNGSVLQLTGTGTVVVTAVQDGNDNYSAATDVVREFNVFKETQTITFEEIADIWIGEGSVDLAATSSASLDIDYAVVGPAAVIDNELQFTGSGLVKVTASQAGSDFYEAATDVVREFNVFKETQTITFEEIADIWIGEGSVDLAATSSASLDIDYAVVGPAAVVDNTLQFTGSGLVKVTASQAGSDFYEAATDVVREFNVFKETQTITFEEITDTWIGDGSLDLDATSSAGLAIEYDIVGPAMVEDDRLQLTGVGLVKVTAKQSGSDFYEPASEVVREFNVFKETQTITFGEIADQWVGENFLNLDASSSVGLAITYEVAGPAVLNGTTLEFTGVGPVQVTAKQAGSDLYLEAEEVKQSFTLFKASQEITFAAIDDALFEDESLSLAATSNSGLAVEYSVTGPVQLVGSTLVFQDKGTVFVTASQPGDDKYLAATDVTNSFEILRPLSAEGELAAFSIYPNPTSDFLLFKNINEGSLVINDMSGRVVMREVVKQGRVDVSQLSAGRYFLSIESGNASYRTKFIKTN